MFVPSLVLRLVVLSDYSKVSALAAVIWEEEFYLWLPLPLVALSQLLSLNGMLCYYSLMMMMITTIIIIIIIIIIIAIIIIAGGVLEHKWRASLKTILFLYE